MQWNHPDTKRYFTRETDKIVRLRHRNADEYRSEVIHIPSHIVEELRPDLFGQRIDILFQNTKTVDLPEYLALWVINKFPKVYSVDGDVYPLKEKYDRIDAMTWSELHEFAVSLGVFKVGMKRDQVKEAINGTKPSS